MTRELGFLKNTRGRFSKSLSARAGVGMESNKKCLERRSYFLYMTAKNPMLSASHCDQIYCGWLRIWHIKFKPLMLQESQNKMSVEYKFGCYDVYQNKNNPATIQQF